MGARKWHQMKPATFEREWERIKGTQDVPVTKAVQDAIDREVARHAPVNAPAQAQTAPKRKEK